MNLFFCVDLIRNLMCETLCIYAESHSRCFFFSFSTFRANSRSTRKRIKDVLFSIMCLTYIIRVSIRFLVFMVDFRNEKKRKFTIQKKEKQRRSLTIKYTMVQFSVFVVYKNTCRSFFFFFYLEICVQVQRETERHYLRKG